MKKLNLKGVSVQTWTRTIVLLLSIVSEILVVVGKTTKTIDIDKTTEILTTLFAIVASVWGFWKNNSYTEEAQTGDKVMNGEITIPCGDNETSEIIDEDGNVIGTVRYIVTDINMKE